MGWHSFSSQNTETGIYLYKGSLDRNKHQIHWKQKAYYEIHSNCVGLV